MFVADVSGMELFVSGPAQSLTAAVRRGTRRSTLDQDLPGVCRNVSITAAVSIRQ